MAAIDGILGILISHGGDELQLKTDQAPAMFARGAPRRLSLPPTDGAMLRHLLAPMLTAEREVQLAAGGRVELTHVRSPGGEAFRVVMSVGPGSGALEAAFFVGAEARPAAIAPAPPPEPPREEVRSEVRAPAAPRPEAQAPGAGLRALLDEARALRASDLHLLDGAPPSVRVDGRLRALPRPAIASVAALLGELPEAELRAAASGARAWDGVLESEAARFRLNVFRTAAGLAAAVRLLPRTAPRLADLGLPAHLGELALAPHGLVIVCGPTGSGKSATLAALAQLAVQRRGALLVGLEDPVEYVIEAGPEGLVRQRQVGRDVPDFPSGLRDALREDPDVILVGEMRDAETIDLALRAAETGHLVLATLHAGSAASAVERIVATGPERQRDQVRVQLAASLRAVVSQRLLARAGRAGRVVAVEILRGSHSVASLVREGRTAQLATAMQSGRKEGMVPLEASLAELVRAGQIARADADAVANDATALAGYLDGDRR